MEQKQKYLHRQVIQQGYNPDDFQQFIIKESPSKEVNLNEWSMEGLVKLVAKFKKTTKKEQIREEMLSASKITEGESAKPGKSADNIMVDEYSSTIKCKKCEQSKFDREGLTIRITQYQKINGSIFEKNYVVFCIQVDLLDYTITRRFSDFEWFRETLKIQFPGQPIPPIAHKGKMKIKQEKHLLKRMYILQKFLNRLLVMPDIRASATFKNFITIKNQKQFQTYKDNNNNTKPLPASKLETLDGELQLKLDDTIHTFFLKTQRFVNCNQPNVKKIYKDFKQTATMLQGCVLSLKSIGANCRTLNANYTAFRRDCSLPLPKTNMFSVFETLGNQHASILQEQINLYRKQIYAMVKYESFIMVNLAENLDKLIEMKQKFVSSRVSLMKKKQKMFDEVPFQKWETSEKITSKPNKTVAIDIMLPRETKELYAMRDNYALFNFQLFKEVQRMMRNDHKIVSNNLEEIVNMESDIANKQVKMWKDLIVDVQNMTVIPANG